MNRLTKMSTRTILAGGAAGGALLVAGVALGLWFGAARETAGSAPAPAPDPAGAMAGMQEMEMQAMEGMAMGDDGLVRIARPMAGALGITSVPAELGPLRRSIRSTGYVTYDETRLSRVSPKFSGWVERLPVDFTGRFVRAGEPLLEIYSPELVSAQEELLAARRLEESLARSVAPGVGDRTGELVEAARRRLLLWDISEEQIREIEETGEVRRTLTMHAPFSGYVVEKDVDVGASVQAGMTLYRIAELSRVWLEVNVYENDLRFARLGEPVEVRAEAYPGESRSGRISYLYPDVDRETRTGRVRVEIANPSPEGRFLPGMFATAHLDALVAERAVLVPRDAVLHFGDRDIVFVELEPGLYEIREVQVGVTAGARTQILRGLLAGEPVVARGNFFLDAESRLMEAMMGMPGMEMDMDMDMPGMDMPGMDRE